jgi:hypothetical protein
MKKIVTFILLTVFCCSSFLPAQAGYYKTIYVEDEKQPNIVINNYTNPTERVVVQKQYTGNSYQMDSALTVLGIGALVGGVILGVSAHKHHKKHKPVKHAPIKHKPGHKR